MTLLLEFTGALALLKKGTFTYFVEHLDPHVCKVFISLSLKKVLHLNLLKQYLNIF